MSHKNTQSLLVPYVYYEMFGYKLLGFNYKQIAEHTGYSYDYVRTLFSKDHVCYDLWQQWKAQMISQNLIDSRDMVLGNLPDLIRNLILTSKGEGFHALGASKILLSYISEFSRKNYENSNSSGPEEFGRYKSFAEWVKAETLAEQSGMTNASLVERVTDRRQDAMKKSEKK